ncbi:hypothetical protein N0K08_12695 [Acidovorax sp. Be4]|jgi:hypothetical protein|uniref:Uncharacterized protein n=1 Tax=Acidovorax bellezanensis TaxID=2976702 RepID=A0ABT2PLZ9_9BURK|nr:hypothetical protein [Acidovorax sp. Be4]MCT9811500.1 hypothetical protein [Acidovorax sp. Be4]
MMLFLEEGQIRTGQAKGQKAALPATPANRKKQQAGPYHPEHIQGNPRLSPHSFHVAMTFLITGQPLVCTQVEDNHLIFCG